MIGRVGPGVFYGDGTRDNTHFITGDKSFPLDSVLDANVMSGQLLWDGRVTYAASVHSLVRFDTPGVVRGRYLLDEAGGERPLPGAKVFADTNGNERFDDGEPLTFTDVDGEYAFANLPAGAAVRSYAVSELWEYPDPGRATTNGDRNRIVIHDFHAAGVGTASVGGTVFLDRDRNGAPDAGLGGTVSGTRVWVDLDEDGLFDDAEPQTVIDGDPSYNIGKLPAGHYVLRTVSVDGAEITTPARRGFTVTDGGTNTKNFGVYFDAQDSSITVSAYWDSNQNGIHDDFEPNFAEFFGFNVTRNATNFYADNDTVELQPDLTYHLDGLAAGSYEFTFDGGAGFDRPEPMGVGLLESQQRVLEVPLTADAPSPYIVVHGLGDSGPYPPAGMSVFSDLDGDRIRDADEPGIITDGTNEPRYVLRYGEQEMIVLPPPGFEIVGQSVFPLTISSPLDEVFVDVTLRAVT